LDGQIKVGIKSVSDIIRYAFLEKIQLNIEKLIKQKE